MQYYRKSKPSRIIRTAFQSFWRRRVLRWGVLLGLPVILFAMFSGRGVLQRMRLEEEKKFWQQKVREAEAEQQRLQEMSRSLDTDTSPGGTVEKVAREKYGMVREGETVYKVKKNNNGTVRAEQARP